MTGKTVLITGATNGIGEVTAKELARLGATVIVVGRSREKVDKTVTAIKAQGAGDAHYAVADLSSQEQVRDLAAHINATYPRLDVLINNAGAMFTRREETVDGIEMTFALNHLNYFLLTHLLLDLLQRSAPARIINTASEASQGSRINFDDLERRRGFQGLNAYAQSKLANLLFTFELARRIEGTGVTVNAMHPGFVGTGFAQNNGGLNGTITRLGMLVIKPFLLSPAQGADTLIWLASSPDVEGLSGGYYEKRRLIRCNAQAYLPEVQRRLWNVSEQMTGIAVPA